MQNEEVYEIDLLELLGVLRFRIIQIGICAIIGALIAGIVSFFVLTPIYSSTAKLYIISKSTSITSLADIQVGTSLTSDYVELVNSRTVLEPVIEDMNLEDTYGTLSNRLTVTSPSNTRLLYITIEDENPEMAMQIANAIAKEAQIQISEITKSDEPTIAEKAVVGEAPVSPNKVRNVAIGLLLGAFLAAGYYVVAHMLDTSIKSSEDVEKYLGLNTLAVIPVFEGADDIVKEEKKKRSKRAGSSSGSKAMKSLLKGNKH